MRRELAFARQPLNGDRRAAEKGCGFLWSRELLGFGLSHDSHLDIGRKQNMPAFRNDR
jgi:hypothetical protein